ncbi:MAG: serine/threonine-protein phosphatase [Sandaracinus sp.]|nr:serine/threonine-protein phosphatase [Sandaracinus sp.]MCB9617070.1 serine/threonine-protein phosphatase [Sandaracinus sp.]MCB9623493.1 serine/threonine-protein phosphatase [Sandaracinus sp.]MCB9632125.1 serine/threonine-protein phosphatase [Sandaracinus sp.]
MSDALVRIVAAGDTHIGLREHNEDAILLRRELELYALADGAGGENAGNVASNLALTTIAHRFEETQSVERPAFDVLGLPAGARRLSAAVHRANAEIVQLAQASQRYQGMGTTVVAASVEPERAIMHLAHVGDSRCYRLRAGFVELLTQDHSLINDVLELAPELPDENAKKLPTRVVTRALGMERVVRVSLQSFGLAPGDRYLLCSDGLTDQLEEEQIADALRQELRPDALVKLLLDVAHAAKARDNVAVVVLDVHSVVAGDYPQPALRGPRGASNDSDPEIVILGGSEPPTRDDGSESEEIATDDDDDEALTLELESVPPGDRISSARFKKPKASAPPKAVAKPVRPPAYVPPDPSGGEGSWSEPPALELDDEDDAGTTSQWPAVKVVPAAPGKAEELKVLLHELPEPRDERDPTIRFRRRCKHCNSLFDGPADVCPFCWKAE